MRKISGETKYRYVQWRTTMQMAEKHVQRCAFIWARKIERFIYLENRSPTGPPYQKIITKGPKGLRYRSYVMNTYIRGRPFDSEGGAWQFWSGQNIYFLPVEGQIFYFQLPEGQDIYFQEIIQRPKYLFSHFFHVGYIHINVYDYSISIPDTWI